MQQQGAPQWREVEIDFAGPNAANPYTDVDAWVIFTHDSGRQLRRPVFWDGGTSYRVRFASTEPDGKWRWTISSNRPDHHFTPASGTLIATPSGQDHPHRALSRGLVKAHPSGRSFGHAERPRHQLGPFVLYAGSTLTYEGKLGRIPSPASPER